MEPAKLLELWVSPTFGILITVLVIWHVSGLIRWRVCWWHLQPCIVAIHSVTSRGRE
jgi:hypothetical protein